MRRDFDPVETSPGGDAVAVLGAACYTERIFSRETTRDETLETTQIKPNAIFVTKAFGCNLDVLAELQRQPDV